MIQICGKPILQHQMECLKGQGYVDIVLIIGYLGYVIKDYFQDGNRFGVRISYIEEKEPLGTAGALYYLKDVIADDFLLIDGDSIFDVDIGRFYAAHRQKGALATIFTHPNSHPYDSGLIVSEADGKVSRWLHKEDERGWYKNSVNAGLHILSPDILRLFDEPVKKDLDRDILRPLIKNGALYSYCSPEYVKDMGTPDRYCEVSNDIQTGLGFLAIVITNQPVIARGEVSPDELREIHNKMETLLGLEGAYVDDIFYCPHHPNKGFPGERIEYKKECGCRKPEPGLILEAARRYNVDLSQSVMIGDGMADVEAGKRAGCKTAFIGTEKIEGTESYHNLLTCVEQLLNVGSKN